MKGEINQQRSDLSLDEQRLFPHLKITNERFPRLLVTRKIENDGAEYFGAFLPETGARFFLDFLNKVFKLRSCTIDIDGSFDVPCPQFYARRCVAPCVENLCGKEEYAETVELLRLFIGREKHLLTEKLVSIIGRYAESLDFEAAAEWRDKLKEIENFWQKNEWILWLDEATDTWEIEKKSERIFVYLATTRGRKTLGKRVFVFENRENISSSEILGQVLRRFYLFHAPKEIRVPVDFQNRKALAEEFSKRENRSVKITVVNEKNQKKTAERAFRRNKFEFELKNIKTPISVEELRKEIKRIFHLENPPNRIEAFDAAHISGTNSVGACVVWENGRFADEEYEFWLSDETSELKTLAESIALRFSARKSVPDLLLIDGGASQLNAVLGAFENLKSRNFTVVSAVKPPGRHGEISHFLTEAGEKILFSPGSETFRFLQTLRDEAHNLANSVHTARRDFAHFYELAAVLPGADEKMRRRILQKYGSLRKIKEISLPELKQNFGEKAAEIVWRDLQNGDSNSLRKIEPVIVPLRFDDPNGDARNLQPLRTLK